MTKQILVAVAALLISLSACAKSIRYSHDEIKGFPPAIQEHIKKSEVAPGMTRLQVRYAWGGPDEIIILSPSEKGEEKVQWIYRKLYFFKSRLIFTDDTLTEIIKTQLEAGKSANEEQ
jgi:hypothetical protein